MCGLISNDLYDRSTLHQSPRTPYRYRCGQPVTIGITYGLEARRFMARDD